MINSKHQRNNENCLIFFKKTITLDITEEEEVKILIKKIYKDFKAKKNHW